MDTAKLGPHPIQVKPPSSKKSWPDRESFEKPVADSLAAFKKSLQRYVDSRRGSAAQERTILALILPTLAHVEASLAKHGILPTPGGAA